ncbi:MAG: 16S rRNA (cytosine(967)-C(5))-methyltransferase RsmB [Verrucomicrobiae bacterium]|nr:16S rRNA (cytosine(967)-C(5))-methyltransferase RsmB [Verrucomicrobiae bacterium]
MNARAQALDLILRWQRSRSLADELLDAVTAERALTMDLFYGWLRHRAALEFIQQRAVPKTPRPVVSALIQLGLYQLHFLKLPAHAAVHETVELAKARVSAAEARLVNAVLRQADPDVLREAPPWIRWSHPQWLWERWLARYGEEQTIALCEWNNQPPPLYARRNTLRHVADSTLPACLVPSDRHPLCYRVTDPAGLFASTAWAEGAFYLQDPSTLLAVDLLDPQPGESVLDLCAAPGGKTTYLAQKMNNHGRIIAVDSSNTRLAKVTENCRRLGVTIVATLACDGTRVERCLRGERFDRVLVDAPCSNTGVMRRRPDLRWRLRVEELPRLAALQRALLESAFQLVRPGGALVYSTCSLEPEENEEVISGLPAPKIQRTLFPPRDQMDGAFVALWQHT